MRSRLRTALILAVGTAFAVAMSACSSGGDAPGGQVEDVTIGYIGDWNGTSALAVANEQNLWEKHGLNPELKVFTNGPLQVQALGTGDLDFGYIGPGAMWLPASGQAKVVAVNTLGSADRVIAQPGITSMQQLRGKTVAAPPGTSGDMILQLALQRAGMTKNDIRVVNMDPSTIVSAFSAKKIDAAGFWYPATATIKKTVPDLVELARNTDFPEQAFPNAYIAGNDVVTQKPQVTAKVIGVLREAMDYRAAHHDEAVSATATLLKLPAEQVKADAAMNQSLTSADLDARTQDGTVARWLSGLTAFSVAGGQIPAQVDPSAYYLGDTFRTGGQ